MKKEKKDDVMIIRVNQTFKKLIGDLAKQTTQNMSQFVLHCIEDYIDSKLKTDDVISRTFFVTNSTEFGEYTPSVFLSVKEAIEWLTECTITNVLAGFGPIKFRGKDLDKDTGYKWLKDNNLVFAFVSWCADDMKDVLNYDGISSLLKYADDTYNYMRVYVIVHVHGKGKPIVKTLESWMCNWNDPDEDLSLDYFDWERGLSSGKK